MPWHLAKMVDTSVTREIATNIAESETSYY